ncbi:MAG: serine/threonine-protein kinase, partial [Myxococcota bacterium]
MEIAAGTVIDDRYEVLGRIGTGAVAEVYLARHLQLGSLVAVKVLLLPTAAVQTRLMQEGRLQGALRDRHVVSVTDMVEIDGCPGLVMEYVRGPSLQRLLQHLQFDLDQARALGAGILLGVRAAHQIGLVHRDLKPANVLIEVTDSALVPKIADFGLAKLLQPEAEGGTATRTGSTLGTPAYMAPEQIRDARQVDERADVFSLGAVLYELLTGRRAFPGDDLLDLYDHIRDGKYVPVRTLAPEVPPELEQVIDAALAVDRDRRIGSVQELLDRFTDGRGDAAAELEWSGAVLSLAAGLAPDGGRQSPSHGASGATFDLEAGRERPAPELAADPPSVDRGLRRIQRPVTLVALAALGVGGAALGCLGGTALIGVGLASDFIEWGPRMAPERLRVAYTPSEIPRVSADPAVEGEVREAWVAVRQASARAAATHLATAAERGDVAGDPGPHLLLATALLWEGDPAAYDQIEQAAVLAEKRKGPVADLARLADAATRGSLDVQRVDAHLAAWPDDLLALLLLASLDGWDPERRVELLRAAIALDPEGAAGRVVLAELWLERGRALR